MARWPLLLAIGTLTGLGYTIDLGVGPVLVACTLGLVVWQCRRWQAVALFLLAAAPWLALHHALNYAVGGSWKPANAIPEYFRWPGCPFNPDNLTGAWHHENLYKFSTYALQMLLGNRGFLGHNLPLLLAAAAPFLLRRRSFPEMPVAVWAVAWSALTWMMYAVNSDNYSGRGCSIRWFVPLLAPGYLLLALVLRERPAVRPQLVCLSLWGAFLAGMMWLEGPWLERMVPLYWGWQGLALVSWGGLWLAGRGQAVAEAQQDTVEGYRPAA